MKDRTIFIEVSRPAYPMRGKGGIVITAHNAKNFTRDDLSPTMTCVFEVQHVQTKEQAIGCIIENLAGKSTTVKQIFGTKQRSTTDQDTINLLEKIQGAANSGIYLRVMPAGLMEEIDGVLDNLKKS